MDFNVNVNAKVNGLEQVESLEKKIDSLSKTQHKISLSVDFGGQDIESLLKGLSNGSGITTAGKKAGIQFSKGFSTAKFTPNIIDYGKMKKDAKLEVEKISTDMKKGLSDVTTKDTNKWANQYVSDRNKAYKQSLKEQETYQKNMQKVVAQQKKIEVQQQIAAMKQNAVSKNSHHDDLVNQGKANIEKWTKQYSAIDKWQSKITEASEKLNKIDKYDIEKYANTNGYQKIAENLEKARAAKERLNAEMSKGSDSNIDNINSDLKIMQSELKKADTQWDKLNSSVSKIDAVKAGNSTLTWLKNNSKATKDYGEALEDLAKKQKSATTAGELESYTKQVQMIKSDAMAKGLTGNSPFVEAKRAISQIGQFVGVYGILQQVPEIGKQMVQAVYDVDTAMTNLYKVTDETSVKYNEFLGNAGKSAQELGRNMSSLITQTSEWAKLGYSLDDSSTLSKISSIYANVGEVDDKTAVSDLVTAMKAYNIEANNSMSIVDSMNKLGNEFATSSGDLGEGLSNAASSLSSAGNDINQSLAMLTGMSEITQSAGESGNALKILSMRLRGYDEETESYSNDIEELTGKVADLTKTVDTPGGISLFTDDTKETYKSTYQIIEEISKIWDKLTDKSRAELTEVLAGKNRGNQISALMQAFQSGQVQKAYNASVNSEGSAQAEQDKWMESMEAKIGQFQATFQQLLNTTINSDFLKGFVDTGTGALNLIDSFIDKVGILQTLIGGFTIGKGIVSFAKNFD